MTNNPFKFMLDFYNESVKDADSIGMADVFKKTTEDLFALLKTDYKTWGGGELTITDVEYLDGYYIFGFGTNSVVHFHIKETPGWKYGIWWEPIETKESTEENPSYETDILRCQIFTQYEEEIDKFKPSASRISSEFIVSLGHPIRANVDEIVRNIKFIHDEPYLAFYREMHWTNYNFKHVSRKEAKRYFFKNKNETVRMEKIKIINDKQMLKTAYTILNPLIDVGDCYIIDRGECWSPRYEIVMRNVLDDELDTGWYGLYDVLGELNFNAKFAKKLIDKKIKICNKRADKVGTIWPYTYHESVRLLSTSLYEDIMKNNTILQFKRGKPQIKNNEM